jgi:site-specific recombinase XerD
MCAKNSWLRCVVVTGRKQMSDLTLADVIKRYVDVRGNTLRPKSLETLRIALEVWLRFLQQSHSLDTIGQLDRLHLEDWLRSLARRQPPLKNSTRRLYILRVRRFLEDVSEWGWIHSSKADLLKRSDLPPCNRQLPKPLSAELDATLQSALQTQKDLWAQGLLLARWTGLRTGELARLERRCLIRGPGERDSIRVPLGKLHNERLIPVDGQTVELIESIRAQTQDRPATVDPDSGRLVELLICAKDGSRLSVDSFRHRLNRLARALGIAERVHPHRLRHTYATELLRFGVSLPGVMKLLGHRSPEMTLRYIEVNQDDLRLSYTEAIRKSRERYPHLAPVIDEKTTDGGYDDVDRLLGDVIATIQGIRFDNDDLAKRKKLQRLVEGLRRIQVKARDLVP